ncbi:serine/threonine protein kinase [Butyrivibrio sp. X503]|uniref:serine/threonine protein kinase n=1 Tax=Butyrivibrio sp. X503 TaxID=2364878 RepID=UPI000EA91902|nr:serine/threonine-protein kinase [Butyrivibrio sp. X503]RKM58418.1 serine/threonine protein kinase [Butyrivibrio sp. X503]
MDERVLLRYKRIKRLGSGGCGDAFLAKDRASGKLVTLKILKATDEKKYKKAAESLRNEADILKALDHKGIPRLIDSGEGYIATEYIPGKSLFTILSETGRLKEKEAVRIGAELIDILDYIHGLKEPVIYRDLKPSNIIIGTVKSVTLIDYGVARIYKEGETADSTYLGTCGFAAPEQYGHLGQTDPKTDIYCFGMTLLQMLSKIDPKDDLAVSRVKEIGVRGVSPELMSIIDKCIKPDREDRFKSCEEIKIALKKYPKAVALRKAFLGIKACIAAACLSAVISIGISYYRPASEYVQEDAQKRLPAVKERLGIARSRIEKYIEEFR